MSSAPQTSPTQTAPQDRAVPTPADIEEAATRIASVLNGVLRNCPVAYAAIGTPDKRCVGVSGDVETVREQVAAQLSGELFGVWRSRDDQRTVFNWLKMPSGSVYLRIASDAAEGAAPRSLIYLDAPTAPAAAVTTPPVGVTPVTMPPATAPAGPAPQPKAAVSAPAPSTSGQVSGLPASKTFQAASPTESGTAVAAAFGFRRVLKLSTPRLNGPDVLAAQNRLIALTLGSVGGQGDGWYGPNTAKAVSDFQAANTLKVTGILDRATWNKLFAPKARKFRAAGS